MLHKGVCAAAVLLLATSSCAVPVRREDIDASTFAPTLKNVARLQPSQNSPQNAVQTKDVLATMHKMLKNLNTVVLQRPDLSSLFGPADASVPATGGLGTTPENLTGAQIPAMDPLGSSGSTGTDFTMNTLQQPIGGDPNALSPTTPDMNSSLPPSDFSYMPSGAGDSTTPMAPGGGSPFNSGVGGMGMGAGGPGFSAGLPPQAKVPPRANVAQGIAKKTIASLEGPKVGARTNTGPPFDLADYLKKHPKAELTGEAPGPNGVLAVGNCNYELKVQPDGNIVIDGKEKLIVWSTKTSGLWNGFDSKDITLKLINGQLRSFILNVRSQPRSKEWKTSIAAGTAEPKKAILGPTGNLLVLDEQGSILWTTGIDKSYECKNTETLMNAIGSFGTQASSARISA